MMSASEGEGGHGKADIVREVACILYYKSVPNADKGGGGQKAENFVDVINGCSLSPSPQRGEIGVAVRVAPALA